jgi:hypothetical protein
MNNGHASEPTTLRDRLEALAAELPGPRRSDTGGETTWLMGSQPFAVLTGKAVELRLDPAVARAATRTPDTTPSDRGAEWVRFAPPELDDHAVDRLEAWYRSARRRAGEGSAQE